MKNTQEERRNMSTLEKIRAEIAEFKDEIAELPNMADAYATVKHCLVIIDKYASEECDNDCEHCAYLECPKEPSEDAVSRQAVLDIIDAEAWAFCDYLIRKGRNDEQMPVSHVTSNIRERIGDKDELPSVQPKAKTGRCKECQYFEYDSVANVDGIPLIVAHEICNKWGDGCKTNENGYCFMFEQKGGAE